MSAVYLDEYVAKFLAGDKEAFDVLYYETQKTVYLSIRTLITNNEVIEDLMQDTYMKAIDNMQKYQIGSNFKAWIARIARNVAINYYNKNKRIEVMDDNSIVFREKNNSQLNYYLSFLDGNEKDIVVYHLILGMKFKDISKILDMPLSTVAYIYKKAIQRIKKEI